ncbi:thermosome subunit alpha [Methanolobus mangrovi]|uniref:Thermosome subunit alpha n=1 Tax=Methanolobus mangrovi TaxID=3072977 RepID=A0AA51YGZ2_9EURY|nr:thermosome subunit alpha [Methanolobus mangrovi]WMW22591.1 thermosome subunit alpha [Methanolobus mangrovi]
MAGYGNQPLIIVDPSKQRTTGKDALSMNIASAKAVASIVKTTLGPKGMDKMLVNIMGDITLTNDGATILDEMDIEHPTAKMIVEIAKTQEKMAGDGTTSAVVMAGALLDKAQKLIETGVHPTVLVKGYAMATEKALSVLNDYAITVDKNDNEMLEKIANTSITGKASEMAGDHLAKICVDAIYAIEYEGQVNVDDDIVIAKEVGGTIHDTKLINGISIRKEALHNEMPRRIENAKIALIDAEITFSQTSTNSKLQVDSADQLASFKEQEKANFRVMIQKIIDTGANAVFCSKKMDDYALHFFKEANMYATRRVKDEDMNVLSHSTGAALIRNINEITSDDLGFAELIEQEDEHEEKTYIKGFKDARTMTILIKGGSEHVTDNIERVFDDALHVVKAVYEDGKIVPGGGASEIEVAQALRNYASSIEGREQLAIIAFAEAIEELPRVIAENCGFDVIDTLINLRAKHNTVKNAGLDIDTGDVVDMLERGIVDPLRVKTQAIKSASESAILVLRVDDMLRAREQSMMDVAPEHNPHNYDMA